MKSLYLSILLLAFGIAAPAQTSNSSGMGSGTQSNGSGQAGMGQTDNTDNMGRNGNMGQSGPNGSGSMNGSKSMSGCIQQTNGNWTLVNKKHPDGIALTGNQDMSAYNGQKVKVMGMWSGSGSSMGGDQGMSKSSTSTSDMGSSSHGGMFNVTEVKVESQHCDMTKMNK